MKRDYFSLIANLHLRFSARPARGERGIASWHWTVASQSLIALGPSPELGRKLAMTPRIPLRCKMIPSPASPVYIFAIRPSDTAGCTCSGRNVPVSSFVLNTDGWRLQVIKWQRRLEDVTGMNIKGKFDSGIDGWNHTKNKTKELVYINIVKEPAENYDMWQKCCRNLVRLSALALCNKRNLPALRRFLC